MEVKMFKYIIFIFLMFSIAFAEPKYIDGTLIESDEITPFKASRFSILDSFPSQAASYSTGLAFDGLFLWNDEGFSHWFARIDTSTGNPVNTFTPTFGNRDMTFDGMNLWVTDWQNEIVCKYDTSDCSIISSFAPSFSGKPHGMAWDGTYLWVGEESGQIWQMTTDGTVIRSIPSPNSNSSNPRGLAYDGQYLWVGCQSIGMIYKIDTLDGSILESYSAPSANLQQGLTFDGQYLWSTGGNNWIYKLDIGAIGIEEVSFSATSESSYIKLQWRLKMENSCFEYIILKKSIKEEIGYNEITRIPGTGSSPSPQTYSYKDEDVEPGMRYYYKLGVVKENGSTRWYGPVSATFTGTKGYLKISPNPFRERVEIRYSRGQRAKSIELKIYDLSGRLVKNLSLGTGHLALGTEVIWDGKDNTGKRVPGGIYLVKMNTGKKLISKKIIKIE